MERTMAPAAPAKEMGASQNCELPLERLYRWERDKADSVFLIQPEGAGRVREWTWQSAAAETRRMAAYLRSLELEPGSRIGILSKNCAWWIMADLAVWMAGHVSVPVYPTLKPETIRAILDHAQCRLCFLGPTEDTEAARGGIPEDAGVIAFPSAPVSGVPRWDEVVGVTPPVEGEPARAADDLATIIYTSGTTGAPKGVMHRFAALRHVAWALSTHLGLRDERFFSYMPLAHIIERCAIESTGLLLGSQISFCHSVDTFVADLKRARPTLFISVPRLLLKFQQGVFAKMPQPKLDRLLRIPLLNRVIKKRILDGLGLSSVRMAASGGAALPVEILNWYRRLGLGLAEGYGMTETFITHVPHPAAVRAGYVGPSVPGIETKIADTGEVLVRSPMNMLGYYRDPAATAEAFTPDGFFRTGDLGDIGQDGQLRLVGRIKDQFKTSKGKYVAPSPIESELNAHPAIEACCLMGAGQPRPFAVVVLSPEAGKAAAENGGRKALEDSITARLEEINRHLDPHEKVGFVAIVQGPWCVANGTMTPTLKVKRNALENRYGDRVLEWSARQRPVVWESDGAA